MNQKQKILEHLLQGKTLTQLKATHVYKCMRLASRIDELRKEGHNIITTTRYDETGSSYAEYSLKARDRFGRPKKVA